MQYKDWANEKFGKDPKYYSFLRYTVMGVNSMAHFIHHLERHNTNYTIYVFELFFPLDLQVQGMVAMNLRAVVFISRSYVKQ